MTHQDVYLILFALAAVVFAYGAIGRYQPVTVILIPGLAITVLAVFLKAAGRGRFLTARAAPQGAAPHRAGLARLPAAHAALAPVITRDLLMEVIGLVPGEWLGDGRPDGYLEQLLDRAPTVPEMIRR